MRAAQSAQRRVEMMGSGLRKAIVGVGRVVGVFALVMSAGCAGASQSPEDATAQAQPSADTTSVAYVLVPDGAKGPLASAALEAVRSALAAAGYNVQADPSGQHDIQLGVLTTAKPVQSVFTVSVNGRVAKKEEVRVTVVARAAGRAIDQGVASFTATDGVVTEEQVQPIVQALSRSNKLAVYARQARAAAEARAESQAVAEEAEQERQEQAQIEQARMTDENEWLKAKVVGCKHPRSIDACDGVQRYLNQHPKGRHAQEAQEVLEIAKPKLEAVQKDNNDWAASGHEACRTTCSREACDGVEVYKVKHDGGVHFDKALSILEGCR